jgi:hypothetical protein
MYDAVYERSLAPPTESNVTCQRSLSLQVWLTPTTDAAQARLSAVLQGGCQLKSPISNFIPVVIPDLDSGSVERLHESIAISSRQGLGRDTSSLPSSRPTICFTASPLPSYLIHGPAPGVYRTCLSYYMLQR